MFVLDVKILMQSDATIITVSETAKEAEVIAPVATAPSASGEATAKTETPTEEKKEKK